MSYVSLDTVIARIQTTVPTATSHDKLIWKEWIYEGLQNLGISDEDVRVTVLYPKEGLVKKPDDMRVLLDLAVYDDNGNQFAHKFRTGGKRIYKDDRLFNLVSTSGNEDTSSESLVNPVDVSEDRYNFILGTNGSHVTQVFVRYWAYPIDEKTKLPLVREDEVMALRYFVLYMLALRKNENQSEIQQAEIRWFREADRVRAQKKMNSLTPEKAKQIQKEWMKLIATNRVFEQF